MTTVHGASVDMNTTDVLHASFSRMMEHPAAFCQRVNTQVRQTGQTSSGSRKAACVGALHYTRTTSHSHLAIVRYEATCV